MNRVIAATSHLQPCWPLVAVGLCYGAHGGYGVTRRWCDPVDTAAAGSCTERWRSSAEEFISARRSALGEHERKVQKASWLGVEDTHEICRVDLHSSLVGDAQEEFHAMPDDRAVFENVPSTILQPKSAWCVLFGRKPLEILWGEGKAYVTGLRHACRSTESLVKRFLFLLDNMALVLGASKGRSSAPSLNHTCREICVISLATFTKWIASETNPTDEPPRSKRYRPRMHSDVDQYGTSTTEPRSPVDRV